MPDAGASRKRQIQGHRFPGDRRLIQGPSHESLELRGMHASRGCDGRRCRSNPSASTGSIRSISRDAGIIGPRRHM